MKGVARKSPTPKIIPCVECGTDFPSKAPNRVRCDSCRKEYQRRCSREWARRHYTPKPEEHFWIACADCGRAFRKRGQTDTRCGECAHAHRLEGRKRRYREGYSEKCKTYYEENKERCSRRDIERRARERDECGDSYARRLLACKSPLGKDEWPQELVNAKIAHLKLRRAMRDGEADETKDAG